MMLTGSIDTPITHEIAWCTYTTLHTTIWLIGGPCTTPIIIWLVYLFSPSIEPSLGLNTPYYIRYAWYTHTPAGRMTRRLKICAKYQIMLSAAIHHQAEPSDQLGPLDYSIYVWCTYTPPSRTIM